MNDSWEPESNIDRMLVVDFEIIRKLAHNQKKKGRKFSQIVIDSIADWIVHFRRSQAQPKEVVSSSQEEEDAQKTRQKGVTRDWQKFDDYAKIALF